MACEDTFAACLQEADALAACLPDELDTLKRLAIVQMRKVACQIGSCSPVEVNGVSFPTPLQAVNALKVLVSTINELLACEIGNEPFMVVTWKDQGIGCHQCNRPSRYCRCGPSGCDYGPYHVGRQYCDGDDLTCR